jgi:hypothetical protein
MYNFKIKQKLSDIKVFKEKVIYGFLPVSPGSDREPGPV